MTQITSLGSFPNATAAYEAITKLSAAFKKAYKRAEKVGLAISISGPPKGVQVYEVRCHATREQQAEMDWMVEAVKTL